MTKRDQLQRLTKELLEELEGCLKREHAADGFPQNTPLDDGQSVELVSQTYFEDRLRNIYRVSQEGCPDQFISSAHSDGGVVVGYNGPWGSLIKAQAEICPAPPEGWTAMS